MCSLPAQDRPSRLDLCLILLFVAAILAPTVDQCIRPDVRRGPEKTELRRAAPRPALELSQKSLLAFPDLYASYFADSFGLRDSFLRWHSIEWLFLFGVSPSPTVLLGRDQWMFLKSMSSMEIFRGVQPLTTKELENWRLTLESYRDYLAKRGAEYLFVIGPNKETIYPDYVPATQNRVGPTRMDQLVAFLEEHSTLRILDLRPALSAARADDRPYDHLYYELGTHWNGRGGLVAGREIQKRLHERFPAVRPTEPSDMKLVVTPDRGDTQARSMYVEDLFPQRHIQLEPAGHRRSRSLTETWGYMKPWCLELDDPDLPRALIFHDSFGPGVEPVLADSFSRSLWLSQGEFDTAVIEAEKPDVVISLYVERLLSNPPPAAAHESALVSRPALGSAQDDRDLIYRLDPTQATPALVAMGKTRLEHVHDRGEDLVSIVMTEGADTFVLPEINWPATGGVYVDLDIATPVPTFLTLFYLLPGETEYTRRSSHSAPLARGLNRIRLELAESGCHGRLRIRPGAELGGYVLHGLEVRRAAPH